MTLRLLYPSSKDHNPIGWIDFDVTVCPQCCLVSDAPFSPIHYGSIWKCQRCGTKLQAGLDMAKHIPVLGKYESDENRIKYFCPECKDHCGTYSETEYAPWCFKHNRLMMDKWENGQAFIDACKESQTSPVPDILRGAAATFEQRNGAYGNNYRRAGIVMAALFPNGITIKTAEEWNRFSIFFHLMNKMMRYSNNIEKGGHLDSAHDAQVYAAMLEEFTKENSNGSIKA